MRFAMDFTGAIPSTIPDLLTKLIATLGSSQNLTLLTYSGQLGNERSRLTSNISLIEISPNEIVPAKITDIFSGAQEI